MTRSIDNIANSYVFIQTKASIKNIFFTKAKYEYPLVWPDEIMNQSQSVHNLEKQGLAFLPIYAFWIRTVQTHQKTSMLSKCAKTKN